MGMGPGDITGGRRKSLMVAGYPRMIRIPLRIGDTWACKHVAAGSKGPFDLSVACVQRTEIARCTTRAYRTPLARVGLGIGPPGPAAVRECHISI